jgi:hypothetical protein
MVHVSRRRERIVGAGVAVLIAGTLVAGCGGGSSGGDKAKSADAPAAKTTTTAKATTTAKPTTTTTTTPKPKPSPQTVSGTLTALDMAKDWKVFPSKPKGSSKAGGDESCVEKGKADTSKDITARSDGKILQKGSYGRYVQSLTYQFADPTKAEAFAQQHLSDFWIECARAATEKTFKPPPKVTVKTFGVERRSDTGTFRGQYSLDYEETVKGKSVSDGYVTHLLYRKGAIVIDLFLQQAPVQGDPADLYKTVGNEVDAGVGVVLARLPG